MESYCLCFEDITNLTFSAMNKTQAIEFAKNYLKDINYTFDCKLLQIKNNSVELVTKFKV